ncbi:hypothetical protein [Caudoviricetes sp.]|nr:hypothetical protein [Caudoviricetes sp.]
MSTEELYTRIDSRDYDRRIYVDKYDDKQVWVSLQVNGGGANCVLSIEQAKAMVAALNKVIEAEEVPA